jgi:hypothetical protein
MRSGDSFETCLFSLDGSGHDNELVVPMSLGDIKLFARVVNGMNIHPTRSSRRQQP